MGETYRVNNLTSCISSRDLVHEVLPAQSISSKQSKQQTKAVWANTLWPLLGGKINKYDVMLLNAGKLKSWAQVHTDVLFKAENIVCLCKKDVLAS